MDIDGKPKLPYDKKTMKDANGQWAPWMNQRAIHKRKEKAKRQSLKKKYKGKIRDW